MSSFSPLSLSISTWAQRAIKRVKIPFQCITYYNKMKKDILQKKGYILELASAANASALFKTENHLLQHSKIASRAVGPLQSQGGKGTWDIRVLKYMRV